MKTSSNSEIATARLSHLSGHIHGQFAEDMTQLAVKNLLEGAGSEDGSLRSLESHAHGMALYAWFADGDLLQSKAWFYTAARLQAKRMSILERDNRDTSIRILRSLDAACTDDKDTRVKIGSVLASAKKGTMEISLHFVAEQIGLLLCGSVDASASATDQFFLIPANRANSSLFAPDIEVIRAIHFGSDDVLVKSLQDLCDMSFERRRRELEGGFTEGLLSTPATIYARLCWSIGRHVVVDHELLPMEWMPETNLGEDEFRYRSLKSYMTF